MSRQARSLRVLLITDLTGPQYWICGPRAAAFKRELENHRVVIGALPDDWATIGLERWIADFRWDAAVVVPFGADMSSSPMGMGYVSASDVRMRDGRPRLFISLVHDAQLPYFYSRGMPTLLPEEPQEAVPLLITAMKAKSYRRPAPSHSIRVSEMAGHLGEHLGLGDREVELLRTAGSLHDFGMIGVRDDVVSKAGPLSEEEWDVMRRHPDIGADLIAHYSAPAEVAPLVRHHHERWDGTGYPVGLKGDAIPFGARILSVADEFDTITGPRLYRNSLMTPIEAVEDISRRANHWFDPKVVDALREIHGLKPLEV